jgi:ribosome biogenesis GTPase
VALDSADRIETVLPRSSVFVRKAAGARNDPQVIATNVDHVFVVTSANSDFNPRRIERYLAAVAQSGAAPVLVINKADLKSGAQWAHEALGALANGLPIAEISALERRGREQLAPYLGPHATVALVGSSGAGKSTLVNWLMDDELQATAAIREYDGRGRHTTTRRELLLLPSGGALIDTPGMREFALWSARDDVGGFEDIEALAPQCRFVDCQHRGQPGCRVAQAIEAGELQPERLDHYEKLMRELSGSAAQRRARQQLGRAHSRAQRQLGRGPGRR